MSSAEVRRLIEKHGYHRRDGELAEDIDASIAFAAWLMGHSYVVKMTRGSTEPATN